MERDVDDETDLIASTTARIFADLADPQAVNARTDTDWHGPLWSALEEAGLTTAMSEPDLPLDHAFTALRISGQYACPVPLAETMLAGWLLTRAGLDPPAGPLAIAPLRPGGLEVDGMLTGTARAVPHAAGAGLIVVAQADRVLTFTTADATLTPRPSDMGGERADLRFDTASPQAQATLPGAAAALERMGAVARACQMTGALESALDLTVTYTGEREAFGRKIAKFQAVQQSLAELAGEVAAALSASGSAAETLAREPHESEAAFLEVAAAKIRVGEAVEKGAMIAHQAHGAIGWTSDYVLQRFTRRIWGWRDDFGAEAVWAVRLGEHVAAQGADRLWPMITTR